MPQKKLAFTQILGVGLILCGVFLFLFFQIHARTAEVSARATAAKIEGLLAERTTGIPGIYADPAMPVFEIDGEDYAALIEVPAFGRTLPVGSSWDTRKLASFPCRFWGSVYDSSLVIGGAGQQGQLDFCDKINVGNVVIITDMTGTEFSYTVACVERSERADVDWLLSEDYDLTIFSKAEFSLEYLAVRCTVSS